MTISHGESISRNRTWTGTGKSKGQGKQSALLQTAKGLE